MKHIHTLIFWKDIEGYEGLYQVNQYGQVKSLPKQGKKERILKVYPNNSGYLRVSLCKDYKEKSYFVHRLVAEAFLPNLEKLPEVDHINGDRTDNRVSNLQWMSRVENNRKKETGIGIPRFVVCIETGQIFPSFSEAARTVGLKSANGISKVCKGKQKTAGGFHWKYATDEEVNSLYPNYVQFLNEVM